MGAGGLFGAVGISLGHGAQHGGVFNGRFRRALRNGEGGRSKQGDGVVQLLRGGVEIGVARGAVDRVVEQAVQPGELVLIGLGAIREASVDVRERGQLRRRGMLRGKARGGAFDDLAHHIEINHLGRVECAHHEAAPADRLQKTFLHQPAERLAHRGATDVQPLRNVLLTHPFARAQFAVAQRFQYRAIDEDPERRLLRIGKAGRSEAVRVSQVGFLRSRGLQRYEKHALNATEGYCTAMYTIICILGRVPD